MNRRHFLQTLATIAGVTLSGNALSIVSNTEPDKYQKTVQLLSDYYLQTDYDEIQRKAANIFNHILEEFDEPLENERVFNEVNKYIGPEASHRIPNISNIVTGVEHLDADIKDSVFPVLTMAALCRTNMFRSSISLVPPATTAALRYENIITQSVNFG